jgi:hypothetical protein
MKMLLVTFVLISLSGSIQISLAQGFYAVSRPTIMHPARGVFFGSVLARPQIVQGGGAQTFAQQKQSPKAITPWAQSDSKAISRDQILSRIERLWGEVRRGQSQAMYALSKIYEKGNPLKPQPAMSHKLLVMAAQKGHKRALADLRKQSLKSKGRKKAQSEK